MKLSIVIPTLQEESSLPRLLPLLLSRANKQENLEIIIADGQSKDRTKSAALNFVKESGFKNLVFINAPRGRGKQLHEGSKHATGDMLYFLHADSHPPEGYDTFIEQAFKNGHEAGCFRMRFRSRHWWLIIIGWFTRFSWKVSRGGDQSQFITRKRYDELGGYNTTIPFYEDYELIHRLYEKKQYHVIQQWLTTSARRYEETGVFKLQWFYLKIYWKKFNGASIQEIYDYYKKWCDPIN